MNTCITCRDTECPDHGMNQLACENWTSDENGDQGGGPDPIAALEARIRGLDSEIEDLKARVARFDRLVAAVVQAQGEDDY